MEPEVQEFLAALENEHAGLPSNDSLVPPGERACPICKKPMPTVEQHGIHVDVCNDHGMWLDRGELPAMIARIQAGKTVSRKQSLEKARGDNALAAAMFGAWWLLLD
jgi:Zn-finger nucleic acid-binding protein